MTFAPQLCAGGVLVTLTVAVQSVGMALFIHWARTHFERAVDTWGPMHSTVMLIRFTSVMIGLHIAQIMLWAWFYRWFCFASWEPAVYFSTTSYSTVGYGDVVLPRIWRNLGPLESVTGVLMCGLSVSLLFAIVTRLVGSREAQPTAGTIHSADRLTARAARRERPLAAVTAPNCASSMRLSSRTSEHSDP